jgi:hypothetical protein
MAMELQLESALLSPSLAPSRRPPALLVSFLQL